MNAPCCPDRAGGRGAPFTAHWFAWHDADGAIDTWATWRQGGLPRTDLELAVSVSGMAQEAGCPMLYGTQAGRWLLWDGSGRYAPQLANFGAKMTRMIAWWVQQAADDVWEAVRAECQGAEDPRAALRQAEEGWKPHRSFRSRIWNDAGQRAIRNQLQDVMSADDSLFDTGTGEIVLDNGRISYEQVLRDGYVRLLPHDPSRLVTRRTGLGLRWEPDARCPAFERFLAEAVADGAQRDWLCWRAANALFGRMPRKGFLNLIGERDSGKSTFTDLMALIGGDYARTVPVETFLARHASDAGFRQHELMGARFVHTHEPRPGGMYDESFMKTLTGRDRMRTAGKYEKPVEWVPQCTPFIGSNGPIRFATSDDAFMSRQEVIRFARGYALADPWLAERLRAELPGILALLLRYVRREARWGTPPLPQSVVEERERLADETETPLAFLAEWLDEGRLADKPDTPLYRCAQVTSLYLQYRSWCDDAGEKPQGRKTFSQIIGRRYPARRSNGFRFQGLAVFGT